MALDFAAALHMADLLMQSKHPVVLRHRIAEALVKASEGETHDETTCRYCVTAVVRRKNANAVLV